MTEQRIRSSHELTSSEAIDLAAMEAFVDGTPRPTVAIGREIAESFRKLLPVDDLSMARVLTLLSQYCDEMVVAGEVPPEAVPWFEKWVERQQLVAWELFQTALQLRRLGPVKRPVAPVAAEWCVCGEAIRPTGEGHWVHAADERISCPVAGGLARPREQDGGESS